MVDGEVTLLQCPVCKARLYRNVANYYCESRHSFDIAQNNYVNLLVDNQKKSKEPGDNKEMMESRRDFLNKGYYDMFSKRLNSIISEKLGEQEVILDAGCGEGYYLSGLKKHLASEVPERGFELYGVDISKAAVKYASKRDKNINYIVASNFKLPFINGAVDLVIRNFAPGIGSEFERVLKHEGVLLIITPGERHLYELKERLYEKARLHNQKEKEYVEFIKENHYEISYDIEIDNSEDVKNLVSMTPYYWSITKEMRDNLQSLASMSTGVHFNVDVYKKAKL
jgi:23S rRNA (guanine745-N1)-methyltransferase